MKRESIDTKDVDAFLLHASQWRSSGKPP